MPLQLWNVWSVSCAQAVLVTQSNAQSYVVPPNALQSMPAVAQPLPVHVMSCAQACVHFILPPPLDELDATAVLLELLVAAWLVLPALADETDFEDDTDDEDDDDAPAPIMLL